MKRTLLSVVIGVIVFGCASAPPEPEPRTVDLAGIYTFTTAVQGMPVDGQMRILGEPGAYEGSLYSQFTGELQFTSIDQSGSRVTLLANTADGAVEIRLAFSGSDTFTGDWVMGPEGGAIQGRRVR